LYASYFSFKTEVIVQIDYDLVKALVDAEIPVIAEGKIHSPE
jgi:putative N-acetylmannosamine-6-phosphate epimerase